MFCICKSQGYWNVEKEFSRVAIYVLIRLFFNDPFQTKYIVTDLPPCIKSTLVFLPPDIHLRYSPLEFYQTVYSYCWSQIWMCNIIARLSFLLFSESYFTIKRYWMSVHAFIYNVYNQCELLSVTFKISTYNSSGPHASPV